MKISGVEHLLLRPADLARSLRFYRDVLQLPCESQTGRVTVRLGGGVQLVLEQDHATTPTPLRGVTLSLQVEDPDVFVREATARGLEPARAAHDTAWGTRMASAFDPDGLELRFERPLER